MMKMPFLPLALAALVLTACGDKPAPASTAAPAEQPKATTPGAAKPKPKPAATAGKPLTQPMPEGVVPKFPYHFRSDTTEKTKAGDNRRVVMIEALGGDIASLTASVTKTMRAAGFRPVAPAKGAEAEADDAVALTFIKKGWDGRVRVVLALPGERKMAHKKGTVMVKFFWDTPATAATAATPAGQ